MTRFEKVKRFVEKYERHLSSLALVTGFTIDNLTLRRVDLLAEQLVLLGYLTIAACSIFLLTMDESKRFPRIRTDKLVPFLPIALQFAFGGLSSAFFVFYSRSASFSASWPFLALLLGYLIVNEMMKKNYTRFGFRITVFFAVIFSFFILFVPVVVKDIGNHVFFLSGIAALIVIWLYLDFLSFFFPAIVERSKRILVFTIGGVYVLINTLYFSNVIPPIPLSLKEAGVYYSITKTPGGEYIVRGKDEVYFKFFRGSQNILLPEGSPLYAYTAVFAPTSFTTTIIHSWQRYDESARAWQTLTEIPLSISGGRDQGFRTYSVKRDMTPGRWRVNVETETGHLIGRVNFDVARGNSPDFERTIVKE